MPALAHAERFGEILFTPATICVPVPYIKSTAAAIAAITSPGIPSCTASAAGAGAAAGA